MDLAYTQILGFKLVANTRQVRVNRRWSDVRIHEHNVEAESVHSGFNGKAMNIAES